MSTINQTNTYRFLYRYKRNAPGLSYSPTHSLYIDIAAGAREPARAALVEGKRRLASALYPVEVFGVQVWTQRDLSHHWDAPGKGRFVA